MMFWIRSGGIVEAVCFTGTRLPGGSSRFAVPGRQSRKYSPIGDCGRASQNTSERREPKPFSVISTSTSAFCVRSSSLSSTTLPALAPGHAHVAALDQAERVVQLHGVAAPVAVAAAGGQREASAATATTTRGADDEPPHRPGGTWVGSQLKSGEGLNGVERSPGVALGRAGAAVVLAEHGEALELARRAARARSARSPRS